MCQKLRLSVKHTFFKASFTLSTVELWRVEKKIGFFVVQAKFDVKVVFKLTLKSETVELEYSIILNNITTVNVECPINIFSHSLRQK